MDTHSLRSQGLAVEEVAGACFCCRFDDLMGKVEKLNTSERPQVIQRDRALGQMSAEQERQAQLDPRP